MKCAFLVFSMLILLFPCSSPVMSQTAEPALKFRNLERLMGSWSGEEQLREDPAARWEKGLSEWNVRWMPGNFVAETSGKIRIGEEETSWIQIWGYDPAKDAVVSQYFDSNGAMGSVSSSGWDGTTFTMNWTDITPNGETVVGRCAWAHTSDFKSAEGTCDRFSNGKWWTFRRVKGKKIN